MLDVSGICSTMRAKLHRLFPADAGSGGPPRSGVGPRRPTAFNRAEPEDVVGLFLLPDVTTFTHSSGCRESACRPPALWVRGAFPGPRPAERRRLSCRLIEGKMSSMPFFQISLDIRDSLLISHLVRKPARKQTNMMVKALFSELPSTMIRPELKIR